MDGLSRLGHLLGPDEDEGQEEDYEAETYLDGHELPVFMSDGMTDSATRIEGIRSAPSPVVVALNLPTMSSREPTTARDLGAGGPQEPIPRAHDLPFPHVRTYAAGVETTGGHTVSATTRGQTQLTRTAAQAPTSAPNTAAPTSPMPMEGRDEKRCVVCEHAKPSSNLVPCNAPGCNLYWHFHCLDPPLPGVPKGRWYCPMHLTQPYDDDPRPGPPSTSSDDDVDVSSSTATTGTGEGAGSAVEEGDMEAVVVSEEAEVESEDGIPAEGGPPQALKPRRGGRTRGSSEVWNDTALLTLLKSGVLPIDPAKSGNENFTEMMRLHNKKKGYVWSEDRLYKLIKGQRVWCPEPGERESLIREAHGLAHQGIDKVMSLLAPSCYWPNMRNTVKAFIEKCTECKPGRAKLIRNLPLRPLHVVPMWAVVHIDLAGPLKTSTGGNRYIILCVDGWSKWLEVGAIPNKEASVCAKWFWQTWICRYGTPGAVVTDRGREWDGEFHNLLVAQRITHRHTAPNNPQANGQCERLVGVMMEGLRKKVNENEDDWEERIHEVAYAYRAARQDSTRVSPALCVFGRELALAATRAAPDPNPPAWGEDEEEAQGVQPQDYLALDQRREALEALVPRVDENLVRAKERNEKNYHKRRAPAKPRGPPSKRRKAGNEGNPVISAAAVKNVLPALDTAGPGPSQPPVPTATTGKPRAHMMASPPLQPAGPLRIGNTAVKPSDPPEQQPVQSSDALSHLPDLPENAKVYRVTRRKHKLQPDREGPFFFDSYNQSGTLALVRDAAGVPFTVPVSQLLVTKDSTETA